jgi:hypothetical protein
VQIEPLPFHDERDIAWKLAVHSSEREKKKMPVSKKDA